MPRTTPRDSDVTGLRWDPISIFLNPPKIPARVYRHWVYMFSFQQFFAVKNNLRSAANKSILNI